MVSWTPEELAKLTLPQREAIAQGQLEVARARRQLLETARGRRQRSWLPIVVMALFGIALFLPAFRVSENTQLFILLIFFSTFLTAQVHSANRRIDALVKLLEEDLRREK